MSRDTYEGSVTNPLSLNLYTYCHNNPVNNIDPSGHMSIGIIGTEDWTTYFPNMEIPEMSEATIEGLESGARTFSGVILTLLIIDSTRTEAGFEQGEITYYEGKPYIVDGCQLVELETCSKASGFENHIQRMQEKMYKGTGKPSFDKQKKGTPGNNQAQNKQVRDIVKKLKLNKRQQRELHDEISGQNYGYQEILETAKDMFGK